MEDMHDDMVGRTVTSGSHRPADWEQRVAHGIVLAGASGRFGRVIAGEIQKRHIPLVTLWRRHLASHSDFVSVFQERAVLLDVMVADGTQQLCHELLQSPQSLLDKIHFYVVGSTGHDDAQLKVLAELAKKIPVAVIPNFSKGVFFFQQILQAKLSSGVSVADAAQRLGFDLGILEIHHVHKKDAPSGTAKALAQWAGGVKKITSLRLGEVAGEHTLFLAGKSEELRISHSLTTRDALAQGAVDLCEKILMQRYVAGGLYSRSDLEGLNLP